MSQHRTILWAVSIVLAIPTVGLAQDSELDADESVTLIGGVEDRSTGDAVPAARVILTSMDADSSEVWEGVTDESGFFETTPIPVGGYRLVVEALPFAPLAETVVFSEAGVLDVDVELVPVDYELDPIVAFAQRRTRLERSGFYQRRQRQGGTFLTREEIAEQRAQDVSDLFRMMPGVTVGRDASGLGGQVVRLRRNCVPEIVLDGVRMVPPVRLDQIAMPADIEGIEVHRGLTGPVQFAGPNNCGRIMIWTREPGEGGQSVISLIKVMGAAAFVAIATIATN